MIPVKPFDDGEFLILSNLYFEFVRMYWMLWFRT